MGRKWAITGTNALDQITNMNAVSDIKSIECWGRGHACSAILRENRARAISHFLGAKYQHYLPHHPILVYAPYLSYSYSAVRLENGKVVLKGSFGIGILSKVPSTSPNPKDSAVKQPIAACNR